MLLAFALSIMAADRGHAVVDVHGRLLGGVLDVFSMMALR